MTRRLRSARTGKRSLVWVGTTPIRLWDTTTGELAQLNQRVFLLDQQHHVQPGREYGFQRELGRCHPSMGYGCGERRCESLQAGEEEVICVAYSPDGSTFASGSRDGSLHLWDTVTGAHRALGGHSHWVTGVAYSSDGLTLVSGGWDSTIRLWDVRTGDQLRLIDDDTDIVLSVAYSPDGLTLASGSFHGVYPSMGCRQRARAGESFKHTPPTSRVWHSARMA